MRGDSAAGRRQFERQIEQCRSLENRRRTEGHSRGWCLGDERFRKELLAQMTEKLRAYHYGPEVQETAEEKANGIVAEQLRRLKWKESDLGAKRKGEAGMCGSRGACEPRRR